MDARLDLGSLENRLTAIEYGLAALHHTMRTRTSEPVATRTDATWQLRAVPANPGKPRMPAPARPPRETDPINSVRRPDDEANLLIDPAFGPPDDLEQIHGVGPCCASCSTTSASIISGRWRNGRTTRSLSSTTGSCTSRAASAAMTGSTTPACCPSRLRLRAGPR